MRIFSLKKKSGVCLLGFFLFAFPASTNYQLRGYGFGAGGEENMTSANYAADAVTGEVSAGQLTGSSYNLGSGLSFEMMAHVPPAPTLTNPSNYYNKLKLVLDTGNNPSDTLFAIAISSDNFVTTNYVQNDNTVGTVLGIEDYQTYATWGGGSGFHIIGLTPSTTYKVKIKAFQGKFSESGYGPVATEATVSPQLSFDIDVSAINTDTDPPFSITFASLAAGVVQDSPENIWVDFSTNADNGGRVYVYGENAGLKSDVTATTILSSSGDLASLGSGFGAQGLTAGQSSGGPLSIVAPYAGTSQVVGVIDTTIREIFSTSAPVVDGRGSLVLKAKASAITPASSDYTEVLTFIASANY